MDAVQPLVAEAPTPPALRCPLCEYDVQGLPEPRCPECGHTFDWAELTDPARRAHDYLYEHYRRAPLQRYFRTAWAALLPWRFWREIRPVHRLASGRLAVYFVRPLIFLFLVWSCLALPPVLVPLLAPPARLLPPPRVGLGRTSYVTRDPQTGERIIAKIKPIATARTSPPISPATARFYRALWSGLANGNPHLRIGPLALRFLSMPGPRAALSPPLAIAAATMLVLLLMRQTFARARFRAAHALRVVAYSTDLLPFTIAFVLMAAPILIRDSPRPGPNFWFAVFLVGAAAAAFSLLRFHLALKYYLTLSDRRLVTAATATIALLLTACTLIK